MSAATEDLSKTENNLIFIEHDTPLDRADMDAKMQNLMAICKNYETVDSERIKEVIRELVPTYYDPEEINRKAESAQEMQAVK